MSEFDPTIQSQNEVLDIPKLEDGHDSLQDGPSIAKTSIARWYAIQVASSCEKKVKATLEQRAVTLGVSNRILEIEIPQTPAVKLKKDGHCLGYSRANNFPRRGNLIDYLSDYESRKTTQELIDDFQYREIKDCIQINKDF